MVEPEPEWCCNVMVKAPNPLGVLQLPNQNMQPFLSQHEKWFPTGKPSLLWDGHNQNLLCQNDGYALLVASMPRIPRPVSILLGCWIQKLGRLPHQTSPRHLPWSRQTHSCWHLGTGWHLSQPPSLPNHWPTGFPLQVFPFYFYFYQSTEHYFPTLWMLPQGCVDLLIPGYGQTIPRSVSNTRQHHLNVAQEP